MTSGATRGDPDMDLATQALMRAAKRARELAARTRTKYVVMIDGKLSCEVPDLEDDEIQTSASDGEKFD